MFKPVELISFHDISSVEQLSHKYEKHAVPKQTSCMICQNYVNVYMKFVPGNFSTINVTKLNIADIECR